ncbi:OsmC family protein [Planctomycetota bacterium]
MEVFENELERLGDSTATTRMSGTDVLPVGPPLSYGGTTDTLNPEELFVASINSCLMLVFDHFAQQRKVEVSRYSSHASGKVEKTPNGLRFTEVQVKATVSLIEANGVDEVSKLATLAEKYCLVSNSVACPVHYQVTIQA